MQTFLSFPREILAKPPPFMLEPHLAPIPRNHWIYRNRRTLVTLLVLALLVGLTGLPAWSGLRQGDQSPAGSALGMTPMLTLFSGAAASTKTKEKETHRYNLRLPQEIFWEVDRVARKQSTTRLEVLRKFILFGLWAVGLEEDGSERLCIMRNDDLVELKLFL